jgi:hypothetical protein
MNTLWLILTSLAWSGIIMSVINLFRREYQTAFVWSAIAFVLNLLAIAVLMVQ